jgi:hypothetical protein
MAVNNLYLLKSGVSGWNDTQNTGISLSNEKLGVGIENPVYKLHIGAGSQAANPSQLAIRDTQFYKTHPSGVAVQILFEDKSGQSLGVFKHQNNDFTIAQADTGAISLTISDGRQARFTESGTFGICQPIPNAKIHVAQDLTGQAVAILENTHNTTPFKVTDRGNIGINVKNPDYTLHVTGHYGLTGGAVGTIYSESYVYKQLESSLGQSGVNIAHTVNFDGPTYRNIELTGDGKTTFGTANGAIINDEVKSVSLKLYASGNDRQVGFDPNIRFLGVKPTGLESGRVAVFALNSFGTGPTDTVAVWREEGEDLTGPAGAPGPVVTGEPGNGFTNKIIGGDFDINPWQRGTYFSNAQDNKYTADRFAFSKSGVNIICDVSRSTDSPLVGGHSGIGFPIDKCLMLERTGYSPVSLATGEYTMIEHRIEGYNWRPLENHGFNLSFFIKSNKTGQHIVSLRNSGNTKSFVSTYNVYTSGGWEKKNLNIPRISGNDWNKQEDIGLRVSWVMAAGTGHFADTGNVWSNGNYLGVTGATIPFNETNGERCPTGISSGDYMKLAAIQLRKGHFFNPHYQVRSVGQELDMCQRYFEAQNYHGGKSAGVGQAIGTATITGMPLRYEKTKRATPEVSTVDGPSGSWVAANTSWTQFGDVTTLSFVNSSEISTNVGMTISSGILTQGSPSTLIGKDDAAAARIYIDSELY